MDNPITVIVFRPHSPLAVMYRDFQWATFGNKTAPCFAVRCTDLRLGLPGFVQIQLLPGDSSPREIHPIQISLAEILLISDDPEPDPRRIGFLLEE